jgi:hypothetical protein
VAASDTDEEFTLMSLSGIGNNLCYAAGIPNSKEGIEGYYCHVIKSNNFYWTMRIRTSLDIDKLKRPGTSFRRYLDNNIFYINKAQLGTEEGLSFGVDPQSTPCFCFSRWNEGTTSGNDEHII